MRTKIVKWGNSLGLRIPKALAEEVEVREGSMVELSATRGQLVMRRAPARYDLQDLLDEVTPENLHAELNTGEAHGKESW